MNEWHETSVAVRKPVSEHPRSPPLQMRFGREGDGMEGDVEAAPGLVDRLEDGLELPLLLHVQGQEDGRLEFPGMRLDERTSLVIQVGDR
jgi:hypothetical protein